MAMRCCSPPCTLVALVALAGCGSVGLDENAPLGGMPMASVTPEGLVDFDSHPVGHRTSEEFTVESIGDSAITVDDAWVQVDDPNTFFVGALPFPKRLDPGDTISFEVTFEPQETGLVYGTVVIAFDDGNNLERNVRGSGCQSSNSHC